MERYLAHIARDGREQTVGEPFCGTSLPKRLTDRPPANEKLTKKAGVLIMLIDDIDGLKAKYILDQCCILEEMRPISWDRYGSLI